MVERADETAGSCWDDAPVEDVVVFTFAVGRDARRALTALHRLHEAGHVRLSVGAVVGRRGDGRTFALEQRSGHPTAGAATRGAAGVAELLRGPFGVVLESAPDALVGSLVDIADVQKSDQLLRCFGMEVPAGCIATIAVLTETSPGVIDAVAARLDAVLVRKPREDVEAEISVDEGASAAPTPDQRGRRRNWPWGKVRPAFRRRR